MISNNQTDCDGDGTTSITCQMGDIGESASKTIYIACQDSVGNKNDSGSGNDNEITGIELDNTSPVVSDFSPIADSYINDSTPEN
jgi:hypothetical protein